MSDSMPPENQSPVLRIPATPQDANKGGSIFGGWIMSQVDIAGSIPAEIRAQGPIVTRAVEAFEFKKPVHVGDLISLYASIIREGRSSITVEVDVFADRINQGKVQTIKVTEAKIVYVAINAQGRPRALPQISE